MLDANILPFTEGTQPVEALVCMVAAGVWSQYPQKTERQLHRWSHLPKANATV